MFLHILGLALAVLLTVFGGYLLCRTHITRVAGLLARTQARHRTAIALILISIGCHLLFNAFQGVWTWIIAAACLIFAGIMMNRDNTPGEADYRYTVVVASVKYLMSCGQNPSPATVRQMYIDYLKGEPSTLESVLGFLRSDFVGMRLEEAHEAVNEASPVSAFRFAE